MSGGGSTGPTKEQQLATWYALNSLNKIDTSTVDNANANMASQAELMSQNLSNRPDYVYSVDGSDEARQRAEQAYYNNMVNNYDFVIKRLGLDFDKVLESVRRNLFNEVYSDQKTGLKNGLINGGIKRLDGKKIKETELNKLLSVIRGNSQTTVENWLRINGYIK